MQRTRHQENRPAPLGQAGPTKPKLGYGGYVGFGRSVIGLLRLYRFVGSIIGYIGFVDSIIGISIILCFCFPWLRQKKKYSRFTIMHLQCHVRIKPAPVVSFPCLCPSLSVRVVVVVQFIKKKTLGLETHLHLGPNRRRRR
jgi:hypothetical protein